MLYQTNVLLVPLGDDFRWEDTKEWDAQRKNYNQIMAAVNAETELNAEVSPDCFNKLGIDNKTWKIGIRINV